MSETMVKVLCICGRDLLVPTNGAAVTCSCDARIYMTRPSQRKRLVPQVSFDEGSLYERRLAGKKVVWSMPSVLAVVVDGYGFPRS